MQIKLPVPIPGNTQTETIENMHICICRLVKQLEYIFANLDAYTATDKDLSYILEPEEGETP